MIKAILVNSVFLNSSAKSSLALSSNIYSIETCEATIGSAFARTLTELSLIHIWVVADHGHARGVLALPVDGDAGEPGVVGVYRLPGCGEVLFRHFAFHPCDDTYAASGRCV